MRSQIKNLVAVIIWAMLSGCSVDSDQTGEKTFSTEQVLIDDFGLTLKPSTDMYIEFERISQAYADTMACMGMTAPGPTVEFRSFSFAGLGGGWAFYVAVESTIWVNIDEDDIILKRDSRTDIEALEHEFIHHILHTNGAIEESRGHSSPLFRKCGLGVRTYN